MNDYNLKFSHAASDQVRDSDYTDFCQNCSKVFGCIGLRGKKYAILNRVYSKEEYLKLRKQIIEQMDKAPYLDKKGRVYKYGEFFPIEISPFAYNETFSQELNYLTKEQIIEARYSWREPEIKNFNITIPAEQIPENIDEVGEKILEEVLGCLHKGECSHQCYTAFRLTDYELKFYKKHNIPLPILCANCRHYARYAVMPGNILYHRQCICDRKNHFHGEKRCAIEFETAYSPERSERVYCETCYNKEVY